MFNTTVNCYYIVLVHIFLVCTYVQLTIYGFVVTICHILQSFRQPCTCCGYSQDQFYLVMVYQFSTFYPCSYLVYMSRVCQVLFFFPVYMYQIMSMLRFMLILSTIRWLPRMVNQLYVFYNISKMLMLLQRIIYQNYIYTYVYIYIYLAPQVLYWLFILHSLLDQNVSQTRSSQTLF